VTTPIFAFITGAIYMINSGIMAYNIHHGSYGHAAFNFMVSLWCLIKTDFRP